MRLLAEDCRHPRGPQGRLHDVRHPQRRGRAAECVSLPPLVPLSRSPRRAALTRRATPAELKELNEWPTFPQLIIKGEFVGGLDVVKEMEEAGELLEMIQG